MLPATKAAMKAAEQVKRSGDNPLADAIDRIHAEVSQTFTEDMSLNTCSHKISGLRSALATPGRPGVRKIAERFGVGVSTVQRISAEAAGPFVGASAEPALL
jgi:hypothetical protein